jgi:Rod binding domain-containing protein
MIQSLSGIGMQERQLIQAMQGVQATQGGQGREKVEQEFVAIFYKELLKQAFKTPSFGLDESSNSMYSTFGSDMMVEKLALELAKSNAFSAQNIFPADIERNSK